MGNVYVLFGKPGAGKGTRQSEFLEGREKDFEVLSVSSLLKKEKNVNIYAINNNLPDASKLFIEIMTSN